jgi:hypothetical protein
VVATTISTLRCDIERLTDLLDCRAGKLLRNGKFFLVVANDEPHFSDVYLAIRATEKIAGRWTTEDEATFAQQCPSLADGVPPDAWPDCTPHLIAYLQVARQLTASMSEIERLKAENVAIKATALEIFSPNCEHHTGENTLPWDEFVARTSKVCMLCALDVITRQADEIEQLRAYTAAYNTLLAERVEIECLRGLAIRAWHSFRSGLTATGGCRDGLTDGDILELVRLANEHPPA